MFEVTEKELLYNGTVIYTASGRIYDFYELDGDVLLLFENLNALHKGNEEEARHNVLRIKSSGKIIWKIQNFKEFPVSWDSLFQEENGDWYVANSREDFYQLDVQTGNVQFSHTERMGAGHYPSPDEEK